jgi:large subunit ribosomal protein L13
MFQPQKSSWLTPQAAREQRTWWVIDLKDQVLGRACSKIAMVLRGKHKPTFTPNVDSGDFVIAINASHVRLTGEKNSKKLYRYHTLFPGGLKEIPYEEVLATYPDRAIESAVWGMLPKGPLGRRLLKKLKIYPGTEHNHAAQNPRPLEI